MNRQEQHKFVAALCNNIRNEVLAKINNGTVPEEWDGAELRQYIADRTAFNVYTLSHPRRRAYLNAIRTIANL